MLVLSRRVDEELVFPNLDVRIKILRTVGNRIRLGIEAPAFIEICRGELVDSSGLKVPAEAVSRHKIRNYLNAVQLAVGLYDRQMDRGDVDGANRTFLRLVAQLRQAELEHPGSQARSADDGPQEASAAAPNVLVVDDDENERQLLAGLLQMDGCVVNTANDGMDAMEVLRRGTLPDVVLLDMQMPRLGGKETLAAIRGNWNNLLVFGVSGSTPAENDVTLGGSQGIDEWFEKPLNPSHLVKRLRQRLNRAVVATL
jgi:carbon storage regulator CsrA